MKQSTKLQMQCLHQNKKNHWSVKKLCRPVLFLSLFITVSCVQNTENRIVIWTSSAEFAQYVELFNNSHQNDKAVIVFKENPAEDLPPARDELKPDLIVGSYLRSDKTGRYFKNLDYLFDRKILSSTDFYPQLIEAGKVGYHQVLLPVSFNLPVVMFQEKNRDLVPNNYTISLEQLRTSASGFNKKNKKDQYTRMGFTPMANPDFLYLTAKMKGADFHLEDETVVYNKEALLSTIQYLKEWSKTDNTSPQAEEDFAYKYLFMPDYRQVETGRCLFSFTTTDNLFRFMKDENEAIEYRWIYENNQIPMEDAFVMAGIYKNGNNIPGATEFLSWFMQSENQQAILERKASSNLDTEKFGIAGGFSAVSDVNERVLPIYYTKLLSNLPPAAMITVAPKLPSKWVSYKTSVIQEYIKDSVQSDEPLEIGTYIKEWQKQMFN